MRAAVPDGKAVDALIQANVKRKASVPLNGTEHEVCFSSQFNLSLNWLIFTGLYMPMHYYLFIPSKFLLICIFYVLSVHC